MILNGYTSPLGSYSTLDAVATSGCKATVEVRKPVCPPNRIIVEGERICVICGSGLRDHANNSRGHKFI